MASRLLKSLFSGKKSNDSNEKRFGSTRLFALKESRWFTKEESNLFENVLDYGYILELRIACSNNRRNVNKDSAAALEYGIVLWMDKPGEKKQAVVIHLIKALDKKGKISREMRYSTLETFWHDGTEIRINNMNDGEESPGSPSKINERVNRASKGSYKWNDSHSFVRWCRYGNPAHIEESIKKRQACEAAIRWGSVSASTGALLYLSRHQRR